MVVFNLLRCQWYCCTMPMRINVGIILLFFTFVGYTQRSCFTIAIVEMVIAPTEKKSEEDQACPLPEGQKEDSISDVGGGKHDWNEDDQAILLAIFFVGYVPFSYVAGIMCDKWGARWPSIGGMIISTVSTAVMPIIVNHTPYFVVAMTRFICGAGQAVIYPGMSAFLGVWVPLNERGTIGGTAYAGTSIGAVIGILMTGLVVDWTKSWVVQFYMWSAIGVIYIIFMIIFLYSTPKTDPHILPLEKEYILDHIEPGDNVKVPYKSILCDQGVWGIIFAQLGWNFVFFTMATNLPKYMNNVLRVDMKNNAIASSLPYIGSYLGSVVFGKLSDYLIKHKNGNVELIRKVCTAISVTIGAVACLVATLIGCSVIQAFMWFTISQFFLGIFFSSCLINSNDLSIHHGGFVMAIGNGTGCLSAVVTPYLIAWMAPDNSLDEWHNFFYLTLGVAVVTSLLYCILGKASRRKWDYTPDEWAQLPTEKPKKKWYMEKDPEVFAVEKEYMLARDADRRRQKKELHKKHVEDKRKQKEQKKQEKENKNKKVEKA